MKKIYEDIKKALSSKVSTGILIGVGSLIVAVLVFSAGISVGFHKASFGRTWGENYERNFGMRSGRFMFGRDNFPVSHGAVGKIVKIELPSIIVEGSDNTEKVVIMDNNTKIQKQMATINENGLSVDDYVVVIGSPNSQGQIEAKFIRVMPFGLPSQNPPASQTPAPTK